MKKVKLTEADLTRIVKRVINENDEEDIDELIDEYRNIYDALCYDISNYSLTDIYDSYSNITHEIEHSIRILDSIETKNDKVVILHDNYTDLGQKINQIMLHLHNSTQIRDSIY